MPRYLLSFLDVDGGRNTVVHGSFEIDLPGPIVSMAEVEDLTSALRRQAPDLRNPVVMGFSLFSDEGSR